MAAGVCTGIFLAGVGLFPMNNLPPHAFTAMWFFRLGLLTVLFFGVAFAVQPRGRVRVGKVAVLFSALTVAAYAGFLVMAAQPNAGGASALDAGFARRPRMWPLAVVEWTVFFATILWFLGVSLMVRRAGSVATSADPDATRAGGRCAPPISRSRQPSSRSPWTSGAPSAPRRSRGSPAPRG